MSIISDIRRIATDQIRDFSRPFSERRSDAGSPETFAAGRPSPALRRAVVARLGNDWLEVLLHRSFDAIQAEPIPAELMNLIEQLDRPRAAST